MLGFDPVLAPPPRPPSPSASAEPSPLESTKPTPFPSFVGPAPEAKKYGSTDELASALKERGINCETLQFLDQPDPTLSEFSLCDPGSVERRFNIYFYPSAPNRKLWLGDMREQKLPLPLVWGPNWIIVAGGDPETAEKRIEAIQGAIGGTIEDFAPRK